MPVLHLQLRVPEAGRAEGPHRPAPAAGRETHQVPHLCQDLQQVQAHPAHQAGMQNVECDLCVHACDFFYLIHLSIHRLCLLKTASSYDCFAFLFSVAEISCLHFIFYACYYRKGGGDGELTEIPLPVNGGHHSITQSQSNTQCLFPH